MNDPFAQLLPNALHFTHLDAAQFVLLLGFIMFFGALGGRIFQKLKIPQVVGYIVIGILIGSSGLQVLRPEIIQALNPINTIALSLIGFLIGAELKIDIIKKYGKQFVGILIGESITPFFVVGILITLVSFIFTKDFKTSLAYGLILGAICSATAPAATTDVLKEYRTRGPLTTTVLGIVAMDDAVALILYAIASTIVGPLLGDASVSFGRQLLSILIDIFGSIAIGSVFGFIVSLIIKNVMTDEGRVLTFALGGLLLTTGCCQLLHLDNILACMSVGFFMVNFAPAKTKAVFNLVDKFTPPIYVLFFVLVGAKLNIWVVKPVLLAMAIIYVVGRSVGKTIGAKLGAKLTKAPETVYKYLPWCLLSQAGVAIGLSIAASDDFADTIGSQIILIITATTFIVQLIGPVCVRRGVIKAGEAGLDITEEDILKKSKVKDVHWGKIPLCSTESPAIVKETAEISTILDIFENNNVQSFVVVNDKNKIEGTISLDHLKETLLIGDFAESMLAMDIMDKPVITCSPEETLPDLYKKFSNKDVNFIPICDEKGTPYGMMEKYAVDHYLHTQIIELHRKLDSLG